MILADIGNQNAHIWCNGEIKHMPVADALRDYEESKFFYISVNASHAEEIAACEMWQDLSEYLHIPGEYEGFGIDRAALCLSRGDGIYIDAGSAITVDKVLNGCYVGGYILPGLGAYRELYASITPVLNHNPDRSISLTKLPHGTRDGISYGIVASIITSIKAIRNDMPLYISGGDARWITPYFEDANTGDMFIFESLLKVIEKEKLPC